MNRRIIGLTTANQIIETRFSSYKSVSILGNAYIQPVIDAGCIPILLSAQGDLEGTADLIDKIDGLILTGGQDIDPLLYSKTSEVKYEGSTQPYGKKYIRPACYQPDRQRDNFEIELYRLAKQKGIPILGICRGLQLINVAEGGTLYQEMPDSNVNHFIDPDGWINYHSIAIAPDTRTCQLMGVTNYFTSSLHHQAIEKLGANLIKSAWAEDNLIEMIEGVSANHFIMGFQGHVEQTRKNLYLYEHILKEFFLCAKKSLVKKYLPEGEIS